MAINPCVISLLDAADTTLLERVLLKADRWFSTSTQSSCKNPISVQCAPDTQSKGQGIIALPFNLARIGTMIFAPSTANNLYLNFTQSFGTNNAGIPQYGMVLLANAYIVFGPEYCGDLYLLNAATSGSTLDVRVIELLRDDSVWP